MRTPSEERTWIMAKATRSFRAITPDGFRTWGDGRAILLGTEGFREAPFRDLQGWLLSLFLRVSLKLFPASLNASPIPWIAFDASWRARAILAA